MKKQTWVRYLLIGINTSLLLVLTDCSEDVDARVRADWVFINQSNFVVDFGFEPLNPMDTFLIQEDVDGPANVTEDSYMAPSGLSSIIIFDNERGDTLYTGDNAWGDNAESIFNVDNYEFLKLEHNYFRFTYRFTELQYENASKCGD